MDVQALEALVVQQLQTHGVAGLALAIVDRQAIIYEQAFGHRADDPATPLTPKSLFLAGSLSKPTFAYLVFLLCERGVLDLDTPLYDLWPNPYSPDPRLGQITARHVLAHTAGFPNWREGDDLPMLSTPGQTFEYSGEGYEYLQRVVEALTDAPLAATWRALVRDPLGMARSHIAWTGQSPDPAEYAGAPLPDRMLSTASAAWSLVTTVGDYARFMRALQPGAAPGLSAASRAAMFTPHSTITAAPDLRWGLGWGLQPIGDDVGFWHWGKIGSLTAGYDTYAAMLRQRQRGVVIFTNSVHGIPLCQPIAQVALEIAIPHPALAWLKH